jgi:hypothetical protein
LESPKALVEFQTDRPAVTARFQTEENDYGCKKPAHSVAVIDITSACVGFPSRTVILPCRVGWVERSDTHQLVSRLDGVRKEDATRAQARGIESKTPTPSLRGALATKQSSFRCRFTKAGLLRFARNDVDGARNDVDGVSAGWTEAHSRDPGGLAQPTPRYLFVSLHGVVFDIFGFGAAQPFFGSQR